MEEAGYDPVRLPPGQYLTENGLSSTRAVPRSGRSRELELPRLGPGRGPLELDWDGVLRPSAGDLTQDIHCVTRWSRFDATFERGPVERARASLSANARGASRSRTPRVASPPTSRLSLLEDRSPARDPRRRPASLARARLSPSARRPRHLLLEERQVAAGDRAAVTKDQPGFWERYGYHNDADPWKEQDMASEGPGRLRLPPRRPRERAAPKCPAAPRRRRPSPRLRSKG